MQVRKQAQDKSPWNTKASSSAFQVWDLEVNRGCMVYRLYTEGSSVVKLNFYSTSSGTVSKMQSVWYSEMTNKRNEAYCFITYGSGPHLLC